MAKKKKETMELRVYDVPNGHYCHILYGDSWIRPYGHDAPQLHFHNLTEIGICRHGQGNMILPEQIVEYSTGTLTMFPTNFPHNTYSFGDEPNFWEYVFFDAKTIVNSLYPDHPVYAAEVIKALESRPLIINDETSKKLSLMIDALISEAKAKQPLHNIVMKHQISIMVLELMRINKDMPSLSSDFSEKRSDGQILSAIDYIHKNYADNIKIATLAEICGISETHFRRVFHAGTDLSPTDYINLVRIQHACELMKKSADPMDIIAEKSGFSCPSTFIRNFNKFLGTSPYQWKIAPQNYEGNLSKYHISPKQGW